MTLSSISLSTERLTLRPWSADDAEALLEMRSNPELTRWLGSPEPWTDIDQATREIAIWNRRNVADDPFGTWAITTTAELARTRSVRSDQETELGTSTRSVAQGERSSLEREAFAVTRKPNWGRRPEVSTTLLVR